ncbi:MAG: PRC-barrel domain-containing protein [Candidatus Heimdallarchaeota archaeon]|nr:PRC-barrel domain-containing protein [Candidatus Heimdallarchaeota archaeon]
MNHLKLKEALSLTELKKKEIISKDDYRIGTIIDVIFDEDFDLHSFIIGGSNWEEFREALGIIDDIDPVVPVENITEITEKAIQLNITKSRLKHKLEEEALPDEPLSYNELKRKRVVDSAGNKFARIVNLIILPCNEIAFVLGGTALEELSEKLAIKEDIDLLLPLEYINTINKREIQLSIPLAELHLTVDNKPMGLEEQRQYLNSLQSPRQAKMKLLCKRKIEEHRDFSLYLYQK